MAKDGADSQEALQWGRACNVSELRGKSHSANPRGKR